MLAGRHPMGCQRFLWRTVILVACITVVITISITINTIITMTMTITITITITTTISITIAITITIMSWQGPESLQPFAVTWCREAILPVPKVSTLPLIYEWLSISSKH